jgi:perosamine synthetase
MTNVAAAIGLAQVERVDLQLAKRREIAGWYQEELAGIPGISWQIEQEWARHVWWMFTAVVDEEFAPDRDAVIAQLGTKGIEARRVVYPMHQLPMYQEAAKHDQFPVADRIAGRGINLPTWAGLTRDDVHFVCKSLRECAAPRSVAVGAQ